MIFYSGVGNKRNYFEGWFFRICAGNFNCALIPSISVADGKRQAYIQVNCNDFSSSTVFDFEDFFASDTEVRIGNNVFSGDGMMFSCDELTINVRFGKFLPLGYDIMGPFKFGTPCKHKIISMSHNVSGNITFRNKKISLENATGYAEKDWGTSFPSKYCWLQCNDFVNAKASFFCSVADIGLPFRGLICALMIKDREYRFATYNFSRIQSFQNGMLEIKKLNYLLRIAFFASLSSNPLHAPVCGKMDNIIKEDLGGKLNLELFKNNKLLYSLNGQNAGIEVVGS